MGSSTLVALATSTHCVFDNGRFGPICWTHHRVRSRILCLSIAFCATAGGTTVIAWSSATISSQVKLKKRKHLCPLFFSLHQIQVGAAYADPWSACFSANLKSFEPLGLSEFCYVSMNVSVSFEADPMS